MPIWYINKIKFSIMPFLHTVKPLPHDRNSRLEVSTAACAWITIDILQFIVVISRKINLNYIVLIIQWSSSLTVTV